MSEALPELEHVLNTLKQNLDELERDITNGKTIIRVQAGIQEQAGIVLEIVKDDLRMLDSTRQDPEKTNKLSPLYKTALRNHYLSVVTTLNAALRETDPNKLKKHEEKLEKLADISRPRLQAALYALAGYLAYVASLVASAHIGPLIAYAPVTYGMSLLGTVPVSMAADKMKEKGKEFFKESEKYSQDVQVIKDTEAKIARSRSKK